MYGRCPSCHKGFQVSEHDGMPSECPNCGYGAKEEKVLHECDGCGGDIKEGDEVIIWHDGHGNEYRLHDTKECAYEFMADIGLITTATAS